MTTAKELGFDIVGTLHNDLHVQGAVHRLRSTPLFRPKFPYIVVSDNLQSMPSADLVTIANFQNAKSALKKRINQDVGIEFLLAGARKLNGQGVGKLFSTLREAYAFCESSGCQFILSSGAQSADEMISGRCFDEILAELGIKHQQYWKKLGTWLRDTTSRKVMAK